MKYSSLIRIAILCLITTTGTASRSENLVNIPVKKFQTTKQQITLSHISDINILEIEANDKIGILHDGRNVWLLDPKSLKFKKKIFSAVHHDTVWFSTICQMNDNFIISINNYTEETKEHDATTPRGGYKYSVEPKGFVIFNPSLPDQHIEFLKIISRPPEPIIETSDSEEKPAEHVNDKFMGGLQSCGWDGQKMFVGTYGQLGKADFEKNTIDLMESEIGQALNHLPMLVEKNAIWYGLDEGGMGGASLEMLPHEGKPQHFFIHAGEDADIVSFSAIARHQGQLFIGTSRGLFQLDERSGKFWRFDLGKQLTDAWVTALLSQHEFLWAFIGESWVRIDAKHKKAVIHEDGAHTPLWRGRLIGNNWILSGPKGTWAYQNN